MNTQTGFIFKIFLVSTILSVLIKYGGESIPIEPTTTTAITLVLLPSIAIGFVLGWQYLTKVDSQKF